MSFRLRMSLRAASICAAVAIASAPGSEAAERTVAMTLQVGAAEPVSVAELSISALETLPQAEVRAVTPWTEGVTRFSGPAFAVLVERYAPRASTATIIALNDYRVTVDVSDIAAASGVVAVRRDGELMPTREKGPAWLVFPSVEHPELAYAEWVHNWIWQIREVRFHVEE